MHGASSIPSFAFDTLMAESGDMQSMQSSINNFTFNEGHIVTTCLMSDGPFCVPLEKYY